MTDENNAPEVEIIDTPAAYEEAALTTLAGDEGIDLNRVHWGVFDRALRDCIENGGVLDHIKKTVIYGKPFPGHLNGNAYTTTRPNDRVDVQIVHALLGIITEAAELAQALRAALFGGQDIDLVNLLEESSDIDWYQAVLDARIAFLRNRGDEAGALQVERWSTNIAKLRKRFGKTVTEAASYNAEGALERDLEGERSILEAGHGGDDPAFTVTETMGETEVNPNLAEQLGFDPETAGAGVGGVGETSPEGPNRAGDAFEHSDGSVHQVPENIGEPGIVEPTPEAEEDGAGGGSTPDDEPVVVGDADTDAEIETPEEEVTVTEEDEPQEEAPSPDDEDAEDDK